MDNSSTKLIILITLIGILAFAGILWAIFALNG